MEAFAHRYFIVNKPFNMVSQFVSSHPVVLLGDLNFVFPEGIHAIGRLDSNSEGLLILTTDKTITRKLFQGAVPHTRTYLVEVRKEITNDTIEQLNKGVSIRIKGGGFYITDPCNARLVSNPYKYIQPSENKVIYEPSSWIIMSLREGKFHQVRKMVSVVGHRCKRLIRISIEDLTLAELPPGGVREIERDNFFKLLKIDEG